MVFSSYMFLFLFLPVALLCYYVSPRRGRQLVLTLMSYLFYGWANPYFVLLLFFSCVINYYCALVIAGQLGAPAGAETRMVEAEDTIGPAQKGAFWFALFADLSLLGFFKYFNFGIDNYNALVKAAGLGQLQLDFFRVALPLGISFYTFKAISYIIDVYMGKVRATRSFIDFSCYLTMFPQLIAGPIVRYQEVEDQLKTRSHSAEKFARGVSFMCLGLAKKVLLADACGKVADTCFGAGSVGTLDAWYGLFAYSFQIYFDFSAYSDMAIGLGLMFGFCIPKNFDSPYLAESFADFWRRWHISLSTWLRDYLFSPLSYALMTDRLRGRMVREKFRYNYPALASSLIVFTICGIWHGAGWTFVAWGAIHGSILMLEQLRNKKSRYWKLPKAARVAATFLLVSFAWVFFRARDISGALDYLKSLSGFGAGESTTGLIGGIIYQPYYLLSLMLCALIIWGAPQTWDFTRALNWKKAAWCIGLLLVSIVVVTTKAHSPFIYAAF
jgi:alginate O-acetyltransferase complex protein AlgI